jgi:uncharacterized membrane protein YcaP (DUF421 family)
LHLRSFVSIALTAVEILGRVTFVYAVLLIVLRCAGRREMRQINPMDLLAMILITRAIGESAMVGEHKSIWAETYAASLLIVLAALTRKLTFHSHKAQRFLDGKQQLLIDRGRVRAEVLRSNELTDLDVRHALHAHGVQSVADVARAWIEPDGEITILTWTDVADAEEHRP